MSFSEVKLARENPKEAIMTVLNRLRCGFMVAKIAVDMLLENDKEEAVPREDGAAWPPHGEAADDYDENRIIGLDQAFVD